MASPSWRWRTTTAASAPRMSVAACAFGRLAGSDWPCRSQAQVRQAPSLPRTQRPRRARHSARRSGAASTARMRERKGLCISQTCTCQAGKPVWLEVCGRPGPAPVYHVQRAHLAQKTKETNYGASRTGSTDYCATLTARHGLARVEPRSARTGAHKRGSETAAPHRKRPRRAGSPRPA